MTWDHPGPSIKSLTLLQQSAISVRWPCIILLRHLLQQQMNQLNAMWKGLHWYSEKYSRKTTGSWWTTIIPPPSICPPPSRSFCEYKFANVRYAWPTTLSHLACGSHEWQDRTAQQQHISHLRCKSATGPMQISKICGDKIGTFEQNVRIQFPSVCLIRWWMEAQVFDAFAQFFVLLLSGLCLAVL